MGPREQERATDEGTLGHILCEGERSHSVLCGEPQPQICSELYRIGQARYVQMAKSSQPKEVL